MLKLCQPRKHLSCCEYFPAEIPTKVTDIFVITVPQPINYIHYFVFVVVHSHESSTKQCIVDRGGFLPVGPTSDSDVFEVTF